MHDRTVAPRWMNLILLGVLAAVSLSLATAATAPAPRESATAAVEAGKTLPLEALGVVPRNNVWWPFRTGPVYGEPASAGALPADSIVLPVGTFRVGQNLNIPAELTNGTQALEQGGSQYFLVKLRAEAATSQALLSIAPVVAEIPVNTLVMKLDRAAYDRVSASPEVALVQPYHAAYKINPEVGVVPQGSVELAESPNFNLSVLLFKGEAAAPVLAELAAAGVTTPSAVVEAGDNQFRIELSQAPASVISRLARMEAVWRIGERGVYSVAGQNGALYLQTVPLTGNPNGRAIQGDFTYWKAGLQGDGQLIQITDTGLSVDAADMSDTAADSGWTGIAPNNVLADHRKVKAYLTANTYGGTGALDIGVGDLLGCDTLARGAYTHGHVVTSAALGNGTRGYVPAGTAPSPTDGLASWNPNQTWVRPYGAGFYQDAAPGNQIFTDGYPPVDNPAESTDVAYDGVAKGAKVVFVDASTRCPEPSEPQWTNPLAQSDNLRPGSIYKTITQTWTTYQAAIHNFSFGTYHSSSVGATYSPGGAYDTDAAVNQYPVNLVIWSAGNAAYVSADSNGSNLVNGTTFNEATCKNCLSVGASEGVGGIGTIIPGAGGSVIDLTSEGPNQNINIGCAGCGHPRHVVTVLAEGTENACRSDEAVENQIGPATCVDTGDKIGTSFAAGNMSGAAAVMREYFAQGFYPDGTDQNGTNASDQLPAVSSRILRALAIVGSIPAPFRSVQAGFSNKWRGFHRFNYISGWGQFFLSRALPLTQFDSKTVGGLIISDYLGAATNGTSGSNVSRSDLVWTNPAGTEPLAPPVGGTTTAEFQVLNTDQTLSVGLIWDDPETADSLVNDLDLKVRYCGTDNTCCPVGNPLDPACADDTYWNGNAFTEDVNEDGSLDPTPVASGGCENLHGDGSKNEYWFSVSNRDAAAWGGLAAYDRDPNTICGSGSPGAGARGMYGRWDNQEGVFIPTKIDAEHTGNGGGDVNADGTPDTRYLDDIFQDDNLSCTQQNPCKRIGKWRVEVKRWAGTTPNLHFAVAIAGPVTGGSSVRFDQSPASCNGAEDVVIEETKDPGDPLCNLAGCSPSTISSRTTVQVIKPDATVRDQEHGLVFVNYPAGSLRFHLVTRLGLTPATPGIYDDGILEVQDGDTLKVVYQDSSRQSAGTAVVKCSAGVDVLVIRQLGPDTPFQLAGGCDLDKYLDQGESFTLTANYFNTSPFTMLDATASLTCQSATGNYLVVGDPNKSIGNLAPLTPQQTGWGLQVVGTPPGRTQATCNLCLQSASSGLGNQACTSFAFLMQADEERHYYITDCPKGCGTVGSPVLFDRNNDEKIDDLVKDNPYDANDLLYRNRSEKVVYEDLTDTSHCTGCGNPNFTGPWNFDTGKQGFTTGHDARSSRSVGTTSIVNWGEDSNWDDTLDANLGEDPNNNGKLDQNWSTLGGCGWMTKAANTTTPGGIWHTGAIGTWTSSHINNMCATGTVRANDAICKQYDRETGTTGSAYWFEMLRTPTIHPVHFGQDPDGFAWKTRILDWSYNLQLNTELYAGGTWEFDFDTQNGSPTQLGDANAQDSLFGNTGLITGGQLSLYGGGPAFANTCLNTSGCVTVNPVTGGATGGSTPQQGDGVPGSQKASGGNLGGFRRGARGCYFNDLNRAGTDNEYFLVLQPKDSDDDCDNYYTLGTTAAGAGCPGLCGVDDDGNGLIDDAAEICPCTRCTGGPRSGKGCLGSQTYCNPAGGYTYLCLTSTDANGKPTGYGDDVCGDGSTDEYVNATFTTGTANKVRQRRNADLGMANGVAGSGYPNGDVWYNTLEDFYGPVGKDWAAELGFIVNEASGKQSGQSYGMGVDDMVIEWVETHPIAQTGTHCVLPANDPLCVQGNPRYPDCLTYGLQGQCATLALGTLNVTGAGDLEIPVSVVDPVPGPQLGECSIGGVNGVYVKGYSGADLVGEKYCLLPTSPGSTEFKGVVKATTRVNLPNDGYVFSSYDGARTPSITIRYFDKYDGVTAHNFGPGPDGCPGVCGLDDDGDGTVDNISEQCGESTSGAPGRAPHTPNSPYRWSDDTCGCIDNPIQQIVSLSYNNVDLVVADVTVYDGWAPDPNFPLILKGTGDGDGFPDPGEDVILDMKVRNLSDFPIENVELTLSCTGGLTTGSTCPITCMKNDRVVIPRLEKNKTLGYEFDTATGTKHFEFVAGGLGGRTNPTDDFGSQWSVAVRALGKATPGKLATDVPIDGTAVVQRFKLAHNLQASGGGQAFDWIEDFESYNNDNSVFCTPGVGSSRCTTAPYIRRNTGDAPGELIGTRCQANNPANPYGNDTQPEDFCQLGEGYSNTENHWHLDAPDDPSGGPTCERTGTGACVDQGRSHGPGSKAINSGMYKSTDLTGGDNNVGEIYNRMYWFKMRDTLQLGTGKLLAANKATQLPQACKPGTNNCPANAATQAPVLEQWVQIATLDWRLFSNVPEGVVMDAAMTYVCVDKNNDGDCDTAEDGIPATCTASGQACTSNAQCCSLNCSANLCTGASQYNSEHWDILRAYYSPEQGFRLNNWINCMYDPSDDGNNENQFYDGSVVTGPSSTCYPQTVDSCVGLTDDDFRGGLRVRQGPICWPETGVLNGEGQTGPEGGGIGFGTWIKRLYNLKPYRGQNVLFRWHVSPGGLSGLPDSLPYSLFNRDDGWYLDDIHLYGRATGNTLANDNANHNPAGQCLSGPVKDLASRVAAIDYPRNNPDTTPKPAVACNDSGGPVSLVNCDYNVDGTLDAATNHAVSVGPGHAYILDGEWSGATYCLSGTLEFRYEDSLGNLVRDWLTDPVAYVTPFDTTTYYLKVRCTADPTIVSVSSIVFSICQNTIALNVTAPTGPNNISWAPVAKDLAAFLADTWDVLKGGIVGPGPFNTAGPQICLEDNSADMFSTDNAIPAVGSAFWYLVKHDGPTYSYSEGHGCGAQVRDAWVPNPANLCTP